MPFDKINARHGHVLEIVMFSLPGKTYSVKLSFLFKKMQFPLKSIGLLWLKKCLLVVHQGVRLDHMEVHLIETKDNKNYSRESRIFSQ